MGPPFSHGIRSSSIPTRRETARLAAPAVLVKPSGCQGEAELTVGYVMGAGDEIPSALEQLGARVELLDADDLAWGDLNAFDVIMTGSVLERRADLRAQPISG